ALRIANTVGAAITNRRELGAAEAKLMAGSGFVLLLLALLGLLWPWLIAVPLAGFGLWLALALLLQAWRLRHPAAAVTRSAEKRDRETI
ncbi:MAG TPA: cardiolipin synthase B, partial [Candidatus Competibacteraceae bacterium]|nr:cardiolipin synthase B [Candidatus Competibacteraceae bacterium]